MMEDWNAGKLEAQEKCFSATRCNLVQLGAMGFRMERWCKGVLESWGEQKIWLL
jgi:hypothetical protein